MYLVHKNASSHKCCIFAQQVKHKNMDKTREEIETLKANWLEDPVWDLEDTEGFEAHEAELKAFAKEWTDKWDNAAKNRRIKGAEKLNLTLEQFDKYKKHHEAFQREASSAKRGLLHYFSLAIKRLDSDCCVEIYQIIDDIIEAVSHKLAVDEVTNESAQNKKISGLSLRIEALEETVNVLITQLNLCNPPKPLGQKDHNED